MRLKMTVYVDIPEGTSWYERLLKSISHPDDLAEDYSPRIPVEMKGTLWATRIKGPTCPVGRMDGPSYIIGTPAEADCNFEGVIEMTEG